MDNWFNEARFGMFIHWGVYSVAGRGEWIFNRERIPFDEYRDRYAKNFKAENYNPKEWAKLAKAAGMNYVVLTTKHHDGYCLWDTKTTDFNSMNYGAKKDLLVEYVEAVRAEGLKVGFYYSPGDWSHPDYPDAYARYWPTNWEDEDARKRFVEYYKAQLVELMSNYGKIDVLWYDGCLPKPLDGDVVNKLVKKLQPDILISARNGDPYDFLVSEGSVSAPAEPAPWEACITLNGSWGYHSGDSDYKSCKQVIRSLIKASKDAGNLLLNVGPMADGTIDEKSKGILKEVGEWLRKNGEAIYNTQRHIFGCGQSYTVTVKGNTIYLHLFNDVNEFWVAEIKNKVKSIKRLSDGEYIPFEQNMETGRIKIDSKGLIDCIDVFACEVEGTLEPLVPRITGWVPGLDAKV